VCVCHRWKLRRKDVITGGKELGCHLRPGGPITRSMSERHAHGLTRIFSYFQHFRRSPEEFFFVTLMQRLLCKEGKVLHSCIHLGRLSPFTIFSHLLTQYHEFGLSEQEYTAYLRMVATAILITTIFQNVAGKVIRPILSPKFCVK